MKNTILYFIRHYLFWFVVFIFFRLIFLISNSPFPDDISTEELVLSLCAGFKLDISTASYFAVLPFLFTLIAIKGNDRFVFAGIKWYYNILILLVILLSVANIVIFKYWGALLNSRGLAYVAQPKEMLASVNTTQLLLLLLVITGLFATGRFFYYRFLFRSFEKINGTMMQRLSACVILLPLLATGIRGGLQLIPVNESAATFSTHRVLNQIAINNIWYLGHNVKQSGLKLNNPYQWMTEADATRIVHGFIKNESKGQTSVFNIHGKPNVVILLLESWTADIIEPLGGIKGVTPGFTELCKEGLLFSSVYSSGFRTDQALISVLSGFPAQPNNSIIRFPDKTNKLPSLARDLKNEGYATSFYYGGELGFANMNSYLVASGFDKISSITDYESNNLNSKWGAHDEYVLGKQLAQLQMEKQPFFTALLTLSTHEPFEVPIQTPFNGSTEQDLFKKAAWYTDHSLQAYFEKVRKTEWYSNTIFILVADHGHRLPLNRDYFDPLIRKIPVLIWSPLLKPEFKGTQIKALAGQNDIAATLLNSLGLPHKNYEWSNNILDSTRTGFAYLSLDMAVTWLKDSTVTIIPLEAGLPGYNESHPGQQEGKAYLQHLYSTFLAY